MLEIGIRIGRAARLTTQDGWVRGPLDKTVENAVSVPINHVAGTSGKPKGEKCWFAVACVRPQHMQINSK